MRYHAQSLFTAGPRRPMDRNTLNAWICRADMFRRTGRITALFMEVAREMARMLGADGRLDPSHDTLARRVGCCARTVRNALARFRELGLADWTRRIQRVGRRVVQIPNAYALRLDGATELDRTRQNPVRAGGKPCRETSSIPIQEAPLRSVAEQLAALADVEPPGGWQRAALMRPARASASPR